MLFVLGEGLVRTGVARQLGDWINHKAAGRENKLLLLLMGMFGVMTMKAAYRSISWKSLVLIVGMLPFSLALQRTGGIDLAANVMWFLGALFSLLSFGASGRAAAAPDPATPAKVSAVAAGDYHSLFLERNGTLWASGRNHLGQLGDGSSRDRSAAVRIDTGVAAGAYYTLMTGTDGSVWATGSPKYGQLPGARRQDLFSPMRIFAAPSASSR